MKFHEGMIGKTVRAVIQGRVRAYDPSDDSILVGFRWIYGADADSIEVIGTPEPAPGAVIELSGTRYARNADEARPWCYLSGPTLSEDLIWAAWAELLKHGDPVVVLPAPAPAPAQDPAFDCAEPA